MLAVVYTKYGTPDVLQLKQVEKPTPKADQVVVKVYATSINISDWFLLIGKPFLVRLMAGGLRKPKATILGADIAGRVEAVGSNVQQFKVGDEVFGDISASGRGGFAEYVAVPENALVLKPKNITFEEAAAAPMASVTALQALQGRVQPGYKVLINGASGGVGTFAIQLAKAFGAEVTAVCSTRNLETARAMGADHIIDYTQEDFTKRAERYDLIIAANGYHPLSAYKRALNDGGTHVVTGGTMPQIFEGMLLGPLMSLRGTKKIRNVATQPNQKDLTAVAELLNAGKVISVLDRCYPLHETAEALRYVGEGHARGKVVIVMEQPNSA